jgi:hypothetical protein
MRRGCPCVDGACAHPHSLVRLPLPATPGASRAPQSSPGQGRETGWRAATSTAARGWPPQLGGSLEAAKYANARRPKPASKRVAEVAGRSVRTPAARERPAAIRHHLLRVVRQGTEEPAPGHPRMRSRLAAAVEQPPVIPRAGAAQEVRAAMSSAGCPPGAAPPAPRCPPPSSSRRENPYPCLVDASCFAQHMRWHQPTGRSVSRHKGDRGQSPDAW